MVLIRRPRDGALLVSESAAPSGALFHRPLGGHVEFGELAADTARREFAEEIGQALTGVRQVGVLENIFLWGEATVHEIVIVLSASFADVTAYEIEEQTVRDDPGQAQVIWRAPGAASPPLYPEGIAALGGLEAGSSEIGKARNSG
jgi:ADP-ribose pyrophosphatase YjhB (NUDIX family)